MSNTPNGNEDDLDIIDVDNFESDDDDELVVGHSIQGGTLGLHNDDNEDEDGNDENGNSANNGDVDDVDDVEDGDVDDVGDGDVDDVEDSDGDSDDDSESNSDGDGDDGNESILNKGGGLMDYIGGSQELEENIEFDEDILGESNKKIVHHDEVVFLHPESHAHNYDEIMKAAIVTRNEDNIIVDKLHTTTPILTKYERPRILGQRTKQLDKGEKPFVTMSKPIMDNSIIAEEELYQKKLPFIIQRGLPGGGFEYWHVRDLEVLRD